MKEFKFSYDSENDDLFVYLEGAKSSGAVEFGDLVLDFDDKKNLVAMQILNASEIFQKLLSKIIEFTKVTQMKMEIINFRNMDAIKFDIITDNQKDTATILIPHIKQETPSPSLSY